MASENDALLGRRLRRRRWMLGLTQTQVAEKVGIKFQQIQKYESGQNRISASRLWDLSVALETRVSYFYEDIAAGADEVGSETSVDRAEGREAAELLRNYNQLPDMTRRRLFDLVRVLSAQAANEDATETSPIERTRPTLVKDATA